MADLNAALVGFLGVLVGSYGSNFLAEDYRRFRDGRSLAGALAGELESHGEPIPRIKAGLESMGNKVLAGEKLELPEWPIPTSPIFEENAAKIGLLGPGLARDVAYVYEHLRCLPPELPSANEAQRCYGCGLESCSHNRLLGDPYAGGTERRTTDCGPEELRCCALLEPSRNANAVQMGRAGSARVSCAGQAIGVS